MLKIWGRRNSSNVRKVLWCAEEIGLAYESIEVGGAFGGTDGAHYRALNPNGLVPVIEDHGLAVWESNAIVRYLSARYALDVLYPSDPSERALGEQWMDWTTSSLAAAFKPLFWGMVRTAPEQRDPVAIAAALEQVGALLALADAALAQRPWLSGDRFTMGDIPLGAFAYGWFEMPIQRPALPHLADWYARLRQRPAYQAGVMTPLT